MTQIFKPGANTLARMSLLVLLFVSAAVIAWLLFIARSPFSFMRTPAGIAVAQPVRFSHELHSGQLNVSCAYCHESADNSSYGGIPDTHTCMSCHSQIATYSELLEPVRSSYETGEPLVWNRVHDLADHVYFNHGIHLNKGVGCEDCHGRVDQMPIVWQANVMTMNWCLECHTAPQNFLRPLDEVYTFGWEAPPDQVERGLELIEAYNINVERLNTCGVCHR